MIILILTSIYSYKFVVKHDFVNECYLMGLEFNEEELEKIFEYIS